MEWRTYDLSRSSGSTQAGNSLRAFFQLASKRKQEETGFSYFQVQRLMKK